MRDAILNASVPTGAVHKQGEKTLSCIAGEILTSGYTLAPADPAKKTTKVTYVVQVRESKHCYSVPVCIRARLYAAVCIHASEGRLHFTADDRAFRSIRRAGFPPVWSTLSAASRASRSPSFETTSQSSELNLSVHIYSASVVFRLTFGGSLHGHHDMPAHTD